MAYQREQSPHVKSFQAHKKYRIPIFILIVNQQNALLEVVSVI